jgi:hypothetical protein
MTKHGSHIIQEHRLQCTRINPPISTDIRLCCRVTVVATQAHAVATGGQLVMKLRLSSSDCPSDSEWHC